MTPFDTVLIGAVLVPIVLFIVKLIIDRINPERSTTVIIIVIIGSIILFISMLFLAQYMGWESTILQKYGMQSTNGESSFADNVNEDNITVQATDPLSSADSLISPHPITSVTATPSQCNTLPLDAYKQQLTKEEINDIYPDVHPAELYPCSFNSFSLSISKLALKTTIKEDNSLNNDLGVFPFPGSSIVVDLYSYSDGTIVEEKTTDFYDELKFESLQDGIYFFIIRCSGYKIGYSSTPFILDHRFVQEDSVMPWSYCIEENDAKYSEMFRIQVNRNGSPLQGKEVQLIVYDDSNPNAYMSTSYTTDEHGYLQLWHGINNRDYYNMAYFNLLTGCHLRIQIDGDYMMYDVQEMDSDTWIVSIYD